MTKVDPVIEKFLKDLWKNIDNKDFVNLSFKENNTKSLYLYIHNSIISYHITILNVANSEFKWSFNKNGKLFYEFNVSDIKDPLMEFSFKLFQKANEREIEKNKGCLINLSNFFEKPDFSPGNIKSESIISIIGLNFDQADRHTSINDFINSGLTVISNREQKDKINIIFLNKKTYKYIEPHLRWTSLFDKIINGIKYEINETVPDFTLYFGELDYSKKNIFEKFHSLEFSGLPENG
jgi:hypothetical protein